MCRSMASRLFQPDDRLVRVRLQQMRIPDLFIPDPELGITGAEPNGSLYERDRLLDEAGVEFTLAESEEGVNIVAIVRERCLVFRNGLGVSALRTQQEGFGDMRQRTAKRRRQGLLAQPFRAFEISRRRVA